MNRNLETRLSKIEAVRPAELPRFIFATCQLPKRDDGGQNYSHDEIKDWLDAGLAHLVCNGSVVFYDGGRTKAPTMDEWLREFAPAAAHA